MKISNWLGIASVVVSTSGACCFVYADGQGTKAAQTSPTANQRPRVAVDEALTIAKKYVETKKIDLSQHYINSAALDLNPRGDRGKFWVITWVPDPLVKGGQIFVHIYMDKSAEVYFGE